MAVELTIKEIAEALGITPIGLNKKAKRNNWNHIERSEGGGRPTRYYPFSTLPDKDELRIKLIQGASAEVFKRLRDALGGNLPDEVREAIALRMRDTSTRKVMVKADKAIPMESERDLKDWQRDIVNARRGILYLIREITVDQEISQSKAIDQFIKDAKASRLDETKLAMIGQANARNGLKNGKPAKRTVSRKTIYRWMQEKKVGELAPKAVEKWICPDWAEHFLNHYDVPQAVPVAEAIRNMKRAIAKGAIQSEIPTRHMAKTLIEKLGTLDTSRKRLGIKQKKALKAFVRRDYSEFKPLELIQADGWSCKARIKRWDNKGYFRPEIVTCIDAATRGVVGFSIGIAENSNVTLDALRYVMEYNGMIKILYTDNGSGFCAKSLTAPDVLGMFDRYGITHQTGIPGNSQGRGMIERLHKTILFPAVRRLGSYAGKEMNNDVERSNYLALKKLDKGEEADFAANLDDLLRVIREEIKDYHDRPHSGLEKITDPITGNKRHLSPKEKMEQFKAEGWKAEKCPVDVRSLRLRDKATTFRGEIRFRGNTYFNKELDGEARRPVIVGYDIHNADSISVLDPDGQYICEAQFEGNKRRAFPVTVHRQAIEKSATAKIKLLEEHKQQKLALMGLAEEQQPGVVDDGDLLRSDQYLKELALKEESRSLSFSSIVADGVISGTDPAPESPQVNESGVPRFSGEDADKEMWLYHLANPGKLSAGQVEHIEKWFAKAGKYYPDLKEVQEG